MNAWVCKTMYYSGICILNALRNLLWLRSKYNRSSFQNISQLNKSNMKITDLHLVHLVEFHTQTGAVSTWMAGWAHWCCLCSHQCLECLSVIAVAGMYVCLYIACMYVPPAHACWECTICLTTGWTWGRGAPAASPHSIDLAWCNFFYSVESLKCVMTLVEGEANTQYLLKIPLSTS